MEQERRAYNALLQECNVDAATRERIEKAREQSENAEEASKVQEGESAAALVGSTSPESKEKKSSAKSTGMKRAASTKALNKTSPGLHLFYR
jgi:hypothetical protein